MAGHMTVVPACPLTYCIVDERRPNCLKCSVRIRDNGIRTPRKQLHLQMHRPPVIPGDMKR